LLHTPRDTTPQWRCFALTDALHPRPVSASEIQSLFARFRALDRRHKGYIGGDELLSVPELAINPLAQRVVQLLGACNFKDFVALLSAFSARASREDALRFMFTVLDVDGDGVLSRADVMTVARARAGGALADEQLAALVDRALPSSGAPLTFSQFCEELSGGAADAPLLRVKVPTDF
jgi:serine/threonine-protein phosphatase 2B regulatory subunit